MEYLLRKKIFDKAESREQVCLESELSPWQRKLLPFLNEHTQDFLFYLLEEPEGMEAKPLLTEEELFAREAMCNRGSGRALYGYRATLERGTEQTAEELKKCYSYIWSDSRFPGLTDMDFAMFRWFHKLKDTISDPDEMLLWSARFCIWGEYDFQHDYSLYRCILSGRHRGFVRKFQEMCRDEPWLRDVFLCKIGQD